MISYGKQSIDQSDIDAVVEVLKSDWLTQGPAVEIFENDLKHYFGSKHACAVSKGTAALHLTGPALGWQPGDIVITTPITFLATANCIIYAGATPDLVDIDSDQDFDLFIGTYDGDIHFFENIGSAQEFNFSIADDSFFSINVGNRSAPKFFDIDLDGDYDMVVGSEESNIKLYWNTGSKHSPNFILDTCFVIPFLGSNLKTSFSRLNNEFGTDMFVGLSTGGVLHYKFEDFSELIPENYF